jgi:hypothetical protein
LCVPRRWTTQNPSCKGAPRLKKRSRKGPILGQRHLKCCSSPRCRARGGTCIDLFIPSFTLVHVGDPILVWNCPITHTVKTNATSHTCFPDKPTPEPFVGFLLIIRFLATESAYHHKVDGEFSSYQYTACFEPRICKIQITTLQNDTIITQISLYMLTEEHHIHDKDPHLLQSEGNIRHKSPPIGRGWPPRIFLEVFYETH